MLELTSSRLTNKRSRIINSLDVLKHTSDIEEPYTFPDSTVIRKSEILYSLNTTALEIFNLFDGKHSVSDVIDEIESQYPDDDVRKDTEDFISHLYNTGLIVK